ncbi:MAG: hypothetical protein ACK4GW_13295, partial [Pseudorhodobacter sp.]
EAAEAERLPAEAAEAEQRAAEAAEAERLAAEAAEAEQRAAEAAEAERITAEAAEAEQRAAEAAEADRLAEEAAAEIECLAMLDPAADGDAPEAEGETPEPETATDETRPAPLVLSDDEDFTNRLMAELSAGDASASETADDGFEDDFDLPPSGRFDDEAEDDDDLIAALSARLSEPGAENGSAPVDGSQPDGPAKDIPTSFGDDFASDLGRLDDVFVPDAEAETAEADIAAIEASAGTALTDESEPAEAASTDPFPTDDEDLDGTPTGISAEDGIDEDAAGTDWEAAVTSEEQPAPDDFAEEDAEAVTQVDAASVETSEEAADLLQTGLTDDDLSSVGRGAEDGSLTGGETSAEAGSPETAPSGSVQPVDAAALMARAQQARARVIRIRRSDAPARPDPLPAAVEPTASHAPDADAAPAAPVRPRRPVSPRRPRMRANGDDDASVKRLIDQTNSELDGPENRRRLSTIAHLKAAVAATVADRKAGVEKKGPSDETRIGPYRNDLERVMRPRASLPDDKPSPVPPPSERPAPLMLVSEQRIDRPRPAPPVEHSAPAQLAPVRPRRIGGSGNLAMQATQDDFDAEEADDDLAAADSGTIFDPQFSFADFADRLGAESLPDLLEAATAYVQCVEGCEHVSRPQMVKHVIALRPDLEEKREDVLRVFGTLLREGRIEKLRRGQFALHEGSALLEKARKAAESDLSA